MDRVNFCSANVLLRQKLIFCKKFTSKNIPFYGNISYIYLYLKKFKLQHFGNNFNVCTYLIASYEIDSEGLICALHSNH